MGMERKFAAYAMNFRFGRTAADLADASLVGRPKRSVNIVKSNDRFTQNFRHAISSASGICLQRLWRLNYFLRSSCILFGAYLSLDSPPITQVIQFFQNGDELSSGLMLKGSPHKPGTGQRDNQCPNDVEWEMHS